MPHFKKAIKIVTNLSKTYPSHIKISLKKNGFNNIMLVGENGEFSMKRIILILLGLIGLGISIKLTMIYYDANFNPVAVPSFCSIDSFIDCDGVAKTSYAQFLGIPNCILGLVLYGFILFLCLVEKLKGLPFLGFLKVFKNPESYIYSVGLFSFIISLVLAGVSIFEIHKVCVLCFVTYFVNLAIALAARNWKEPFFYDIKTSINDFKDAIKVKRYAISFIAVMTVIFVFLAYSATSYAFVPQLKKSQEAYSNLTTNPYKAKGNILGDADGKIIINLYTDYMCPFCYNTSVIVHKLATELKGVRVKHHNLPLDTECNKYLPQQVHQGACQMARYGIAAGLQGKYWEMNSQLFETMPKDEGTILKLAKKIHLDTGKLKADANSEEVKAKLIKEIDDSMALNIVGTPTIVINMKKYEGLIPYNEMKSELLKLGATEKK